MDVAALWTFSDPVASEARFREAIARAADPEEAAVLRTQLARSLGLQERYAEALAELDAVAGEQVGGPDSPEVATREQLERGRVLRSRGDGDAAEPYFGRAAQLAADASTDDLAGLHVDALHMLAMLPSDPAEQVRRTRAALDAARQSSYPAAQRWQASLLNNLGMALHDSGDDEAALTAFGQALELRRTAAEPDDEAVAVARWMVAWCKRLLGRTGEAEAEQTALAADNEASGRPDPYVHDELAELAQARGDHETAAAQRAEAARLRD